VNFVTLTSLFLPPEHFCGAFRIAGGAFGAKPYARVHFGSSEWKSVSARWPPTRSWSCKL